MMVVLTVPVHQDLRGTWYKQSIGWKGRVPLKKFIILLR